MKINRQNMEALGNNLAIKIRPAKKSDFEFLFELKKQTMKEKIIQTWGIWDENLRRNHYKKYFRPKKTVIISEAGEKIGQFTARRTKNTIVPLSLEIKPEFQNKKIGTYLLGSLILEAIENNKECFFQVLKVNTRAIELYLRLGLSIIGETESHVNMKYKG